MVTSGRPGKTLWKIFNLLAAKGKRKEQLITCEPNWGTGGVHQQVQRCWDSHGLSSERYLFIQSVVKQILHPESLLRAGEGAWLLLYLPRGQTLEKGVKECVCWREEGREG